VILCNQIAVVWKNKEKEFQHEVITVPLNCHEAGKETSRFASRTFPVLAVFAVINIAFKNKNLDLK